jgi:hypothetical protein
MYKELRQIATKPALPLAVLVLTLYVSSCGSCHPRPSVISISPTSVVAGSSQFLLMVNGNDFRFDSFVTWNGAFRPTTFISTHQLVAVISASDVAVSGTDAVRVFTPGDTDLAIITAPGFIVISTGCGGGNSNVATLIVTV